MSEDMKLTKKGRVVIVPGAILVEDFKVLNGSCRDVAILGAAWAIGELQHEMIKTIQRPGGGNIAVDETQKRKDANAQRMSPVQRMADLRRLLLDDGFCSTFQSMGQYRATLAKWAAQHLQAMIEENTQ